MTTNGSSGDIFGPMAAGVIAETDILADLFDQSRGKHDGSEGAAEMTFYKNGGGGHLDLMTARLVVARAAEARTA